MGKDADACCEACKVVGSGSPAVAPTPPLRARHEDVKIVVRYGSEVREVLPNGPRVWVGRTSGNDVVLPSGTISKRQCEIVFTGDQVLVRDGASSCGTVIGGRKIFEPTPLPEGAAILVGDFELRVVPR